MHIKSSADRYETWLRTQLEDDFDEEDLAEKHKKMTDGAFQFLRATYWRWAETILDICPELNNGPEVLAVGDIHLENFGTWRDAEGRLVWGVNDFDEAAHMPYPIDLVRLAASAIFANVKGMTSDLVCDSVLKGYREGIEADNPKPFVLDRDNKEMRRDFVVDDDERARFWKKLDPVEIAADMEKYRKGGKRPKLRPVPEPPGRHAKVLKRAWPDCAGDLTFYARTAGTGSLGRPRFVGVGEWRGDFIVRETKAMVPSGWVLAHRGSHNLRCEEIATGRYRAPDPTYLLRGHVLVRRLSPNDFKIEVKEEKKENEGKKPKHGAQPAQKAQEQQQDNHKTVDPGTLVNGTMLEAMGYDLAAIHRATRHVRTAIRDDLAARPDRWLCKAVEASTRQVMSDFEQWTEVDQAKKSKKVEKKTTKKAKKAKKPKKAK